MNDQVICIWNLMVASMCGKLNIETTIGLTKTYSGNVYEVIEILTDV